MRFCSLLLPIFTLLGTTSTLAYQIPTIRNVGSTLPIKNFDPLGFSKNRDIDKLQEAEIKHGRVAMLASLGLLVQNQFHPFIESASKLSIQHYEEFAKENPLFTPILLSVIGAIEGYTIQKGWKYPSKKFPAELRSDYIPGKLINTDASDDLRNKEINHGRLAMIFSIIYIFTEFCYSKF